MTKADLLAIGLDDALANRWVEPFNLTIAKYDLGATKERLSMWIAQCWEESIGFTKLRENLNYRATALRQNWPARFPTDEVAQKYEHRPEAIANYVYGGRNGNGPEASGDGWKFRGRGCIEITFKNNYQACGKALGIDLVQHPELLEVDKFAALSAGWYWSVRKINPVADQGDVVRVTEIVNGGHNGLEQRKTLYERIHEVLRKAA